MKRPDKYILNDAGEPVPCDDLLMWGVWMETGDRVLKQDYVEGETRTYNVFGRERTASVGVSTIFLGLDHSFGSGPPVLWESMVFGTSLDGEQRRYTSRAAALKGHAELVALVREAYEQGGAGLPPEPDTANDTTPRPLGRSDTDFHRFP